jgi:hypothetical protein
MLRVSCTTHPCSRGCSVPEFWQVAIDYSSSLGVIMVINSTPSNSTEDFLFHVHVVTTTFPGFGIFRQTATRLIVSKHIYGAVIQAGIKTAESSVSPLSLTFLRQTPNQYKIHRLNPSLHAYKYDLRYYY